MLIKAGLTTLLAGLFLAMLGTTLLAVGIKAGAPVVLLLAGLYVVFGGVGMLAAVGWREK